MVTLQSKTLPDFRVKLRSKTKKFRETLEKLTKLANTSAQI